MTIANKLKEWVYAILTSNRYTEYDLKRSFNRVNQPQGQYLIGTASTEYDASSTAPGVHEVRLAWRHVRHWMDREYPDMALTLQPKCTDSDLNDFQKDLTIELPQCVREFFKMTDGQFGSTTDIPGLVYGLKLCSLDDIVTLTEQWRRVVKVLLNDEVPKGEIQRLVLAHRGEDIHSPLPLAPSAAKKTISKQQRLVPPGAIVEAYAHPMWIPLITDETGNCIGIDLAPGPKGEVGQVILFGRDFDDKIVVAPTWGDFLLGFANDLEQSNWSIHYSKTNMDDDIFVGQEGDLVFVDHVTKQELPYLQVLRLRAIRKWIKATPEPTEDEARLIGDLTGRKKQIMPQRDTLDTEIHLNILRIANKLPTPEPQVDITEL